MTYEDIINSMAAKYTTPPMSQWKWPAWTMTDNDSAQVRRDRLDGRFEFVEMWEEDDGYVVVFHKILNLDDYSDGELWFYGSLYYPTQEEFENQGAEIMAECVFEQEREVVFCGTPDEAYKKYIEILESEG